MDAYISRTAVIKAETLRIGAGVSIGDNTYIEADVVELADGVIIENDCVISCRRLQLGHGTKIERGSVMKAIGRKAEYFELGDYSFLGFSQQILLPFLKIGDYTAVHNTCLLNGYKSLTIGHNCWIGQGSILNATDTLTIGNNVRIGTHSRLWTHVASGEALEGCVLNGSWPLEIENDVWIVGGAVISPNLILREKSVIMAGAVLTKSTESAHCYAGVPAIDITKKLSPYRIVTLEQKKEMMERFVEEFKAQYPEALVRLVDSKSDGQNWIDRMGLQDREAIVIFAGGPPVDLGAKISVFSLETKTYGKKRTTLEESFIRFNLGYRARFVPHE